MLPAPHRLNRGDDLRRVSRRGRRRGCDTLVVHAVVEAHPPERAQARVGFVVSKAVGSSVVRHRVQRRLRELAREQLAALPAGAEIVVRALEPARHATYEELRADLTRCLRQALADTRGPRPGTVS